MEKASSWQSSAEGADSMDSGYPHNPQGLGGCFYVIRAVLGLKGANWNPGYSMLCYKVHEGHSLMQLGKPMETLHTTTAWDHILEYDTRYCR